MQKQNSSRRISNRTLFLLVLSSFILFIFSFIYFIFVNNNQINNNLYYKAIDARDTSLTTITRKESWSKNNLQDKIELLAKETIEEDFIAQADNLGIIAIPFNNHNKSISDQIVFRLKETGGNDWYFQSTYNANQIQTDIPFPFGFPTIPNSKNKTYTFQIESLTGRPGESLSLSQKNTYFISTYKFSKAELLKNPKLLMEFLFTKIINQLQYITIFQWVLIVFFTFSPFILYKKLVRYKAIIVKNLKSLKSITIKQPLDRIEKIQLSSLIIGIGFFFSVSFHYFQGIFYNKGFPINSFIPNWFFGDFFGVLDQWSRLKFTGVGYGLSYFPGTYLIVNLFTTFFTSPYMAVFVYLAIFTVFLFIYTYKNIKTGTILESLQNAFIISLMSYPFIFAFQTANIEIITFISVSLFFIFYTRNRLLSVIFLAYAISTKVFPGIFIVLLLLEKRYKDIFLTCIFTILFTLFPLLIFNGGFNKGIGNYITHISASQHMYADLMIVGGAGSYYGHSLLNGLRTISPNFISSMSAIIFPYTLFALFVFIIIAVYLIRFEKIFWRRVAILVMMMNLLPFTSTDYKLLYIFLPLFFLTNHPKRDKYDSIFIILLSLLLIPKDYIYFNNNPLSSFNVVANPIIMLIILLLIIFLGIKSSKSFLLKDSKNNKLKQTV